MIVEDGFEVVILDTYQKATPGIESYDDTKQTPILHFLSNVTRRLNITLVILDHLRKEPTAAKRQRTPTIDDIKGSGAKVQNSDVVFLQERQGNRLNIRGFSKDSSDSPAFAIELVEDSNRHYYRYIEDLRAAYTSHQYQASRDRDLLLQIMQPGEWYSMGQLRQISGKSASTLQRRLNDLIADRKVIKQGTYKSTRYQQITNTSGQKPSD